MYVLYHRDWVYDSLHYPFLTWPDTENRKRDRRLRLTGLYRTMHPGPYGAFCYRPPIAARTLRLRIKKRLLLWFREWALW